MTYFPWSQEYSVGVRLIDRDHKELVEQVNALHEQISETGTEAQIAANLAFLARYVKEHFTREEALMAEYGYPDLVPHRASHHKLADKIHAAQKVFAADPKQLDPRKFLLFLREWLVHHILVSDMKYVPYLHGEAARPPAESNGVGAQPNGAPRADETAVVEVEVPTDKVDVIRRCAKLLGTGSEVAAEIEALAEPTTMTLEEAEQLIAPLLR